MRALGVANYSPWSNRPRNRLHPPAPALSGRLQRGWCCFDFRFKFVASMEKLFQWICDSSLSFSWQKGDRPDNDLSLSHAASRQKKSLFQILVCSKRLFFYMLSYILCCPVKVTSGWSKEILMASFIRLSFTTTVMLTASLFVLSGQGQPPKSPLPKKSIMSDQNPGHAIVS